MTTAFLFPGQGSQFVGMGKELAVGNTAAREVFTEVDDALGDKLSAVIFDGPEDDLRLTRNTQPALMAVSMALVRCLETKGFDLGRQVAYVAGHSLGEYSALAAAGAVGLADAARLLRRRGEAMQRAVPVGQGAMAAVLGLELHEVEAIARDAAQGEVCDTANDNAPGQVVVSGARSAVERAVAIAAERGAKRSILLPVSAPFHCALMQPAADEMAVALEEITILPPKMPVIANVTAEPVEDPGEIRELLTKQVTATVRWRESMIELAGRGVDRVSEVGAGKVLSGLMRRIARDVDVASLQTEEDVDSFLENLN